MTAENIIRNIKTGLKGDNEKDIEFLTRQLFKYKNNENYSDIAREIGVLLYDRLPPEEQAVFSNVLFGKGDKREIYNEAYNLVLQGNYQNAQVILGEELKNIRRQDRDKDKCQYLSFNDSFELYIYTEIYNRGIAIRPTPFEYNLFYKLYSYAFFKLERYDKALEAIEEAVFWNPVSSACLLDMAELYKIKGELEKMAEVTQRCLKYAYQRRSISRCYRNLGYYYTEKKEYETAICLYVMSNEFEESKQVINELSRIIAETGKKLRKPGAEEIKNTLKEKGIQLGASVDILKLAAALGGAAAKSGEKETAMKCYDILFKLTADIEVEKRLKELKRETAKRGKRA